MLTAAHCTKPTHVVLGEYDTKEECDCVTTHSGKACLPRAQSVRRNRLQQHKNARCTCKSLQIRVAQTIPHAGFDARRLVNDIALVRLASLARTMGSVMPICLPLDSAAISKEIGVDDINDLEENELTAVVVGWGRLSSGTRPQLPRTVNHAPLPILSNKVCKRLWGQVSRKNLTSGLNMILNIITVL